MQRIGCVLHISPSRNMILKAENVPRVGDRVVNENLRELGRVFDVFGPVSAPYVAVRPTVNETSKFIDHILYAISSPKLRREKTRR